MPSTNLKRILIQGGLCKARIDPFVWLPHQLLSNIKSARRSSQGMTWKGSHGPWCLNNHP